MLSAQKARTQVSDHFALGPISLDIKSGEIVSIIGPNGSGKSTLLRMFSRLLGLSDGDMFLDGKNISSFKTKEFSKKLTMLPQVQQHSVQSTVYDLVAHGRNTHRKWYAPLSIQDRKLIDWAMDVTRVTDLKHRDILELSGGQRQRVWIAMCLAQNTNVLLLDEPTTYLDIVHQLEVLEIVKQVNEEKGVTVVMVLHDLQQAATYSKRVIAMQNGKVMWDGAPQCVFCNDMFHSVFGLEMDITSMNGVPLFVPKCMRQGVQQTCEIQ
ncbi:MAG: ABC transporter ATP-binding protein [Bacilli bacterium]